MSSLPRALRFWRDALGMEVVLEQTTRGGYFAEIVGEPDAHGHVVHLRFPGSEHRLELHEYLAPPAAAHRLRPPDVGFAHVAVTCDDLDAWLVRLVAAGGEPFSEPVLVDRGVNAGMRAVYVRDPDGHTLELVQPAAGAAA